MANWMRMAVVILAATMVVVTDGEAARRKSLTESGLAWDSITQADWDIGVDSSRGILDAAVIFERIESDDRQMEYGKHFVTIYQRIRILSKEGQEWGDVEVPYVSANQRLVTVQARSIQPNGDTAVLESGKVRQRLSLKSKRLKVKTQAFSIPGVTDNCIVEWRVKLRLRNNLSYWAVQKEIPLLHGELQWHVVTEIVRERWWATYTSRFKPFYLTKNLAKRPMVEQQPNVDSPKVVIIAIDNVAPFVEEPLSLPSASLQGGMYLYYSSIENTRDYWGRAYLQGKYTYDYFFEDCKQIENLVSQFDLLATQEEKMKAAYDWVQANIRNVSYRPTADTNDLADVPDDANGVFKKGLAYDTEINAVYCEMLRQMDIDARMGWLVKRTDNVLVLDAMFWQFDHCIVAVADSQETYRFFSPGDKCTQFGMIPWFAEGVSALLVADSEGFFYSVPFSEAGKSRQSSFLQVALTDDMRLEGTMKEMTTGHLARSIRLDCFDAGDVETPGVATKRLKERFVRFDVDSVSCMNVTASDSTLRLAAKIATPDAVGDRVGERLLLQPLGLLTEEENSFTAETRKHPIILDYARESIETIEIEIPAGWTVEAVAADTVYANQVGSVGRQITTFGNKVAVQRIFKLPRAAVAVEDYAAVRALYAAKAAQAGATISLVAQPN